jgi:hypothetical protein
MLERERQADRLVILPTAMGHSGTNSVLPVGSWKSPREVFRTHAAEPAVPVIGFLNALRRA